MENNRIANAKKNITAGLCSRIISIAAPFIARTVLLRIMGSDYLGLNSLFISILSVLNLAELGVDSAITYNMYKPIATGDIKTVNSLLNLYKRLYRIVGFTILLIGLAVMPFLHLFIHDNVPEDISIKIVFLVYLGNAALGYLLFAHKRSLLIALQRNDITSNITTLIIVLQNTAQVVIYYFVRNYYVYIFIMPIATLASNFLCEYISRKKYGIYKPEGIVNETKRKEIRKQIAGLVASKLTMQSRNAFDNIVVSSFIGLTAVTIYSNYFYLINAVHSIVGTILLSTMSIIGNSVAIESKEKNLQTYKAIQFIYMWISIWTMSCVFILYQDFMKEWAGNQLLLPFRSVVLFSLYGFLLSSGDVKGIYTEVNGLWWHIRYHTLIEAAINLLLNVVLGKIMGIDGVILASIIAVIYSNIFYGPYTLFRHYFGLGALKDYLIKLCAYCICFVIVCIMSYIVCNQMNHTGLGKYLLNILVVSACTVLVCYIHSYKNQDAQESKEIMKKIVSRN